MKEEPGWRALATELLEALEAEHSAIDLLLAVRARDGIARARRDPSLDERDFFPTNSTAWPAVEKGAEVMKKARALLK